MKIQQDKISKRSEMRIFLFVLAVTVVIVSSFVVKEKKECTRISVLMGTGKDLCVVEVKD